MSSLLARMPWNSVTSMSSRVPPQSQSSSVQVGIAGCGRRRTGAMAGRAVVARRPSLPAGLRQRPADPHRRQWREDLNPSSSASMTVRAGRPAWHAPWPAPLSTFLARSLCHSSRPLAYSCSPEGRDGRHRAIDSRPIAQARSWHRAPRATSFGSGLFSSLMPSHSWPVVSTP